MKKYNTFVNEARGKFISFDRFEKLKKLAELDKNKNKEFDPYGEENWLDEKIPSLNRKDYDIWFKLKKDFGKYKKNKKFDCFDGLVRGLTIDSHYIRGIVPFTEKDKINFDDEEWFEPILKLREKDDE